MRWHFVEARPSNAPVIVFLHGVPCSWWQWHYALEAFGAEYRCLAIDLKGYGQSEKGTGDFRQEESPSSSKPCWTSSGSGGSA